MLHAFFLSQQFAEAATALFRLQRFYLRGGQSGDEAQVFFFLIQHRHEPILQTQRACTHHLHAKAVIGQSLLPREHRRTDARAACEFAVKRGDESLRSDDQHAVSHGYDGGDAFGQQRRRHRGRRVKLRLRALTGFEEDERYAMIADHFG